MVQYLLCRNHRAHQLGRALFDCEPKHTIAIDSLLAQLGSTRALIRPMARRFGLGAWQNAMSKFIIAAAPVGRA